MKIKIRNKKIFIIRIIEIIVIIATIILTIKSIQYANATREFEAFGGEYLIPYLGLDMIVILEDMCEKKKYKSRKNKNKNKNRKVIR